MTVALLALVAVAQPTAEFYVQPGIGTATTRGGDPWGQISAKFLSDDGQDVVGTSTDKELHRAMVWKVGERAWTLPDTDKAGYHYRGWTISGDRLTGGGDAVWTQPGTR